MIKKICEFKKFKYVLSLPDEYDKNKKYPVFLFLHGAGSRGNNIDALKDGQFLSSIDKLELEVITVQPQCYADTWFEIFEQLIEFTKFIQNKEYTDITRYYLFGVSMGGYASWQLGMTLPKTFAAMIPICGGGMYWNAEKLKDTKIWAFHGSVDSVVYPEESEKMVNAINQHGGDARLTIYEGVAHPAWEKVYSDKTVFEWCLAQKIKPIEW